MSRRSRKSVQIDSANAFGSDVYLSRETSQSGQEMLEQRFAPSDEARLDARFARSYVFVPFADLSEAEATSDGDARSFEFKNEGQIRSHIKDQIRANNVTDLVVMAHGWHRNLFSAMAAYDRLTGIYLDLFSRGKLEAPRDEFRPLLIGVHFHSDLGDDKWLDYSGRRDRESFLDCVRARIVSKSNDPSELTSDFESVYDLFSRLAAPGVDASDPGMAARSFGISEILGRYTLVGSPHTDPKDVLTVAWACYHEAEIAEQTVEQTVRPSRSVTFFEWLSTLLMLFVGVGGLVGGVYGLAKGAVQDWIGGLFDPNKAGAYRFREGTWADSQEAWLWPLLVALTIYLIFWLGLGATVLYYREVLYMNGRGAGRQYLTRARRRSLQNAGTRMMGTIFYLPLQIVHILPLILWCLVTPFFTNPFTGLLTAAVSGIVTWNLTETEANRVPIAIAWAAFWGLVVVSVAVFSRFGTSSERPDFREGLKTSLVRRLPVLFAWPGWVRRSFARFASWPIKLAKRISRPDQAWMDVWQSIENLLAFWTMADKAVVTGREVGKFVEDVLCDDIGPCVGVSKDEPAAEDMQPRMRVHFIGHSHGSLVVCNAVSYLCRNLERDSWVASKHPRASRQLGSVEIQSLTTINGAFRSDWYEEQSHVVEGVSGCIATLFSRYDTANKLWYPLANMGRKSAGSVGSWLGETHPAPPIVEPLPYVSLTQATYVDGKPSLKDRIAQVGQCPKVGRLLNIDASRFVFKGPFLPQGAHSEIYTKDTVAAIWNVLLFSEWRRSV